MLLISKEYRLTKRIPEDFGFRHLRYKFMSDPVDVIAISKEGEKRVCKPLLFICQDSLPQAVIRYNSKGLFDLLPFDELPFLEHFHLIIIGKPMLPIIEQIESDQEQNLSAPLGFLQRNYAGYYVCRNNFILKQLFKERWTTPKGLTVIGLSQGSSIAAKMTSKNCKIANLIYSNGNPYGDISEKMQQARASGTFNKDLAHWKSLVQNYEMPFMNLPSLESKSAFSFMQPHHQELFDLTLPVLVSYPLNNPSTPFNDLFQVEAVSRKLTNFSFQTFEKNQNTIASEWLDWLNPTRTC